MKVKHFDYKKQNMSVWNEVAPRYHKRWATSKKGPFQSTKKLVELIDVKKGDRILDVASGTGVVTKLLNQKVGKLGFVVGADTSTTAIKVAKKWNKKSSNILFVNTDAENFSFKEKFDIITCQYALFFFPNAQKALKNMKNSLKESGKLGISVHGHPNRVPYFDSIFEAVTQFIPNYVPPGTPDFDRFGTKKSLRDEIKKAGFRKITVKDYNFPHSPGTFEQYWGNYLRYVAKPIKEKLNSLDRSQKKELKEMVKENTKPYTKKNGIIQFPWEVLILTAKH
ncbi:MULTISPECIES: methyltransferase domain-containing protein [Nitrosopumilus]|uniref:Methyltransferase type 11 n=1 Tax=Nitrosopumilus piranensis TaxID=1582439 RepID=A0A0C5C834_9ARCH|nr:MULTISPECIES: methyltransferase domain-containing protein [Nitrosopumilus]AJM91392.1 Methyltransferase type 11 [Nitrosopumilus piranensis]KAF6245876.1 methyltransferase type 11 [Nitrosopumilus sp. b2]